MALSRSASLSLDLLRVAAASGVVLYHTAWLGLAGGALPFMTPKLGHLAVVVFFVLSGFVIAATTRSGQLARDYAIKRIARVYSVALPAVVLVMVLSYVSQRLGVTPPDDYELRQPLAYFGLHMLFGGDLWSLAISAFSIGPYWSLNYEVWYYVIFGVAFFTSGLARHFAVGLVLLLVGPKIVLLLPVWLGGVAVYALSRRHVLPSSLARVVAAVSLILLFAFTGSMLDDATDVASAAFASILPVPLRFSQWFLGDYIRGVLTGALIWSLCSAEIKWPDWLAYWGKELAGVSFSLYLLHFPLMTFFRSMIPAATTAWAGPAVALLAVALSLAFGRIFEPQRDVLRRVLVAVTRTKVPSGT